MNRLTNWIIFHFESRWKLRRRIWQLEGEVFDLELENRGLREHVLGLREEVKSLKRYRSGQTDSAKKAGKS